VIVPDGVLFGSSKAHKELRRLLVEEQKLDAVISLPGGVFKPYAGVSTAILLFTKTNSGGTDHVWFYDVDADGQSLDDKRTPLLSEDKLGPTPRTALTAEEHAKNNLPNVLLRWRSLHQISLAPSKRERARVRGRANGKQTEPLAAESPANYGGEFSRKRTEQSFLVPKADIAAQGYDLSINRYKELLHDEVEHAPPHEILAELAKLEAEIQDGMKELEGMLR
jgi:type I restriction enzyme M protein